MSTTTTTRHRKAVTAYLATYEGPWGLKASDEDALLSILVALYPKQFPKADAENIYKLRDSEQLSALADYLYEELNTGQLDENEIIDALVPEIDKIMGA